MSLSRTVLVCEAHVPFVHGGAELHVRGLVDELTRRGYRAERVSVPFKWYPKDELLTHAAAWRMIDLSESNGERIDTVIATKFPTYFVRHPNKVTWLFHQYRAIYDLCGTPYSEFGHTEADVRLRDRLIALDNDVLAESRRLFTNARNTAARLARYNGLAAEPLYHPPPLAGKLTAGPLRPQLEETAARSGVGDRITFAGAVAEQRLIELYAGALGVVFPPFDEDYGYVTLEAFLARKPVVTTIDAGGPLEFVEDGVTGFVVDPTPEAIGGAIARLASDAALAQSLGDAGYERARAITWDGVVDRLMADG